MARFRTSLLMFVAVAVTTAAGDALPFKIATKRNSDRVEVRMGTNKVLFTVHSPVGISSAVIERTGDKWPDAVVLRLKLAGLEDFQAANGKATLGASVSSHDAKVRLSRDGKDDERLDATSPFWTEVHMIGRDGQPSTAIPLKDGYFELQLPKAFFAANPKSITLSWIDFYRQ